MTLHWFHGSVNWCNGTLHWFFRLNKWYPVTMPWFFRPWHQGVVTLHRFSRTMKWCNVTLTWFSRTKNQCSVTLHCFSRTMNRGSVTLPRDKKLVTLWTEWCHFSSKLARDVGRVTGWREKVFGRRYQAILVSDEPEAQIARLRYLLSHGCKEGLVGRLEN